MLPVQNWKILLKQSFIAHVPLLMMHSGYENMLEFLMLLTTPCPYCVFHAVNCRMFCFGRHQSVFLFVYEISLKLLNIFAPNAHGRHVWSLAQMSLKVKVKGQGHQGQKSIFGPSAACVWFMFGETSLDSSFMLLIISQNKLPQCTGQ